MKIIKVAKPKRKSPVYTYSPPSRLRICKQPRLTDPYERKTLYIKETESQGQGVFAKRDIAQNEIVAYYIGTIHYFEEVEMENRTFADQLSVSF